jgi:hypothetical protein
MTPPADKLSPAGNVPLDNDHVYGGVPPVAARLRLYAVPTCPFGKDVVVITGAAAATIVSESTAELLCAGCPESVTLKVSDNPLTAAVGVPLMTPLADKLSPAGSVPLDNDHV